MALIRVAMHLTFLSPLTARGCTQLWFGAGMLPYHVAQTLSFRYENVEIHIVDGETMEPIAGASVGASYDYGWNAEPEPDQGVTDSNGIVRLRIESRGGAFLGSGAPGYMDFSTHIGGKSNYVLALYRPPEPTAGIEVPRGYRGIIQIAHIVDMGERPVPPVGWQRGQRAFFTRAKLDGVTEIVPPPRLSGMGTWSGGVSVARFDDGTTLPIRHGSAWYPLWRPPLDQLIPSEKRLVTESVPRGANSIALWELGVTDDPGSLPTRVYCVGTYAEAKAALTRAPKLRPTLVSPPG